MRDGHASVGFEKGGACKRYGNAMEKWGVMRQAVQLSEMP